MVISIDDPRLPALIRAGDPAALKLVVQTYLGQIMRAARGMGLDRDAADDVTQATFATFIEKQGAFEGRSHVRTWLFGILYRKVAEARRARQRDGQMDEIDELVEQRFDAGGSWVRPPRPVESTAHDAEIRRHLAACLENLPERQRQAFLLREAEEYGSEEVCNILQISRTNLGVLLFRARNRLRECLESRGVEGPE